MFYNFSELWLSVDFLISSQKTCEINFTKFFIPLKSGIPVVPVVPLVPLRDWSGLICCPPDKFRVKLSESILTNVPEWVLTKLSEFLKLDRLGFASWSNCSSLFLRFNSALNSLSFMICPDIPPLFCLEKKSCVVNQK